MSSRIEYLLIYQTNRSICRSSWEKFILLFSHFGRLSVSLLPHPSSSSSSTRMAPAMVPMSEFQYRCASSSFHSLVIISNMDQVSVKGHSLKSKWSRTAVSRQFFLKRKWVKGILFFYQKDTTFKFKIKVIVTVHWATFIISWKPIYNVILRSS